MRFSIFTILVLLFVTISPAAATAARLKKEVSDYGLAQWEAYIKNREGLINRAATTVREELQTKDFLQSRMDADNENGRLTNFAKEVYEASIQVAQNEANVVSRQGALERHAVLMDNHLKATVKAGNKRSKLRDGLYQNFVDMLDKGLKKAQSGRPGADSNKESEQVTEKDKAWVEYSKSRHAIVHRAAGIITKKLKGKEDIQEQMFAEHFDTGPLTDDKREHYRTLMKPYQDDADAARNAAVEEHKTLMNGYLQAFVAEDDRPDVSNRLTAYFDKLLDKVSKVPVGRE